MSVAYSICGTILSKLVALILNAVYYENIIEKESSDKYKYMLKTIKSTYHEDVFVYSFRLRKAFTKVKFMITIRDMHRNLYLNTNILQSKLKAIPEKSCVDKKRKSNYEHRYDSDMKDLIRNQLLELSQNKMCKSTDVNEIMSPQPYYDVNVTDESYINLYGGHDYPVITRAQSFTLLKRDKKNTRGKIIKYMTNQSDYGYTVGINKKKKFVPFTALQIIDKEWVNEEYRSTKKRSSLKTKLFVFIFVSSYIFLIIMVTDIYNKYEENIFQICISPLLAVVISKFLITQNVMIFVHCIFMYKFGEKFYSDNRRTLNPLSIVFKYVIPPVSKATHKVILTFQKIAHRKDSYYKV